MPSPLPLCACAVLPGVTDEYVQQLGYKQVMREPAVMDEDEGEEGPGLEAEADGDDPDAAGDMA